MASMVSRLGLVCLVAIGKQVYGQSASNFDSNSAAQFLS